MAVKILPKKTVQRQEEACRRFMRETRTLRHLRHSNIVRLQEVMETQGNYYLVMDLLEGQNLKTVIRNRYRKLWTIIVKDISKIYSCARLFTLLSFINFNGI